MFIEAGSAALPAGIADVNIISFLSAQAAEIAQGVDPTPACRAPDGIALHVDRGKPHARSQSF